ncbi:unnamed protein product [Owenia fusiformis]|uniref:Uncharacterized protein n=1 Tax=Owenia fusiformis TaxID=6347 RepID=A0A8J1XVK5_OWEFU|nr:unnamed protein product [Owenia fusiformis]
MGMFSMMSNKKKTKLSRSNNKMKRMKRAQQKIREGVVEGEIVDAGLITVHHLRKRRTNPKANIQLSGKKKNKLKKQLLRMQKEKNAMEITAEDTSVAESESTESKANTKQTKKTPDVSTVIATQSLTNSKNKKSKKTKANHDSMEVDS